MPRRSRGCQACRQKRKRCDGAVPSCQRCLRLNQECSGPVQGPIIINETRHVLARHEVPFFSSEAGSKSIITQPSQKLILSQAFLSEFISFIGSNYDTPTSPAWLTQLDGIPQDQRGAALDLSLQATATAHCGVQSQNPSAIREACKMYGEALSLHRRSLSKQTRTPTTAVICTSVILSLFESIWSTSFHAYCVHLTAAREMLSSPPVYHSEDDPRHAELHKEIYLYVQYQTVRLTHLPLSSLYC
jgi:hypothetical protein